MTPRICVFWLLSALVAVNVVDHSDAGILLLLKVRDELFARPAGDAYSLSSRPGGPGGVAFVRDDPSDISAFGAELVRDDASLRAVLGRAAGAGSATRKAEALLYALTDAERTGECGLRVSLPTLVRRTRGGIGCCSDYSKAFVALASVIGLTAREVSSSRHTFVEFFDPGAGRWIFADPTYGLLASRGAAFASAAEVAVASRRGMPLATLRFSTRALSARQRTELEWLYAPSAWERLMVAQGNNVIEWSRYAERLAFLPRPAQQLMTYAAGVRPWYVEVAVSSLDAACPYRQASFAGASNDCAGTPRRPWRTEAMLTAKSSLKRM